MTESRTRNSTRNIIFSATAYLIQIILGFLVRRYFIYYFNEEFLGLNSLFSNILTVLSLAEMGIGGAIVFAMYKPMAEKDTAKVNALLNFYKKCYITIGCLVTILGLCVVPFMGYFKAKAPKVDVNLYAVYLIYLFNSVISYFFAHRRALLYTDQRQDIESKVNIVANLGQSLLQLVIIIFIKNFYLYLGVVGVTNLISNVLIYIITNKKYNNLINGIKNDIDADTKKLIKKNVLAMLFHKIGGVVVFGTDSILIYLLIGASVLGRYSNYVLITTNVGYIFTIYINAIRGSIGNSIASRNEKENYDLFNKLNMIHFMITSFCTVCIFVLANPFIDTILTKDKSISLLLDLPTLIIICVNFYLSRSRELANAFKECAGLFYQDRFKPIAESIINLVSSIVLAKFIGLSGIILGTIISTIAMPLWVEPYVLNKCYFKKSNSKYFLKYLYYSICMLISCAITYFVCGLIPTGGIWLLVLRFGVCAVVAATTLILGFMFLPEFKQCVAWGKSILGNIKLRHQTAVVNNESVIPVEFVAEDPESMENSVLMSDIILAETLVENEKNATNKIDNKDDSVEKIDNGKIISQDNNEESAVKPNGIETNMSNCSDGKTKDRNTDNFDKD